MTTTIKIMPPSGGETLDQRRPDASFTSPIRAQDDEAHRVYRWYLEKNTRAVPLAEEAAILGTPDVVEAFANARADLDAWKHSL